MILSEKSIRKIIRKLVMLEVTNIVQGISNSRVQPRSSSTGNSDLSSTDISNDSLSDVDIGSFEKKLSASGAKRSANMNSVRQMAAATGLRIDFVYGIQTRESGGKASAMALNPHLLSKKNSKYATAVGISESDRVKIINAWKEKGVETRKPRDNPRNKYSGSYFNAHKAPNSEIFKKMFTISPTGTISGAALGLYQVLGWFMLSEYGNDGKALYDAFQADPLKYSNLAFVKWVNHSNNADFKKLVNDGESNWGEAVKKYYGANSTDYTNHVKEYAKYFRESVSSIKKKSNDSNLNTEDWSDKLGKFTAQGINFHKLTKGGNNNYRAGMKPKHVNASPEFFKSLKRDYGIDTVITLNADNSGGRASNNAKAAGMNVMYAPASDSGGSLNIKNYTFDQIEAQLDKGNTLIHCTHGADRTGAVVGRYYVKKGMSKEDALKDAYRYKSDGKSGFMAGPTAFINKG